MKHIPQKYLKDFFSYLREHPSCSKQDLSKFKVELCRKHKVKHIPTDIALLLYADEKTARQYLHKLPTKPNSSLSGVSPVAIMTSPHPCPHGKCRMCPGGMQSPWGDIPQSYTGGEPATMRAQRAKYNAYIQVFNRLEQYIVTGHTINKIDLIIMGGTFPARTKEYQDSFIRDALAAMNDFSELFFSKDVFNIVKFKEFFELPGDIQDEKRTQRIQERILKIHKNKLLQEEQKRNEKALVRCIGMTIETRPDWGLAQHGNKMLEQGCTRVELGIQSVQDEGLQALQRGHDVVMNKKSIRELRDLGFKLNFHMMLGLPTLKNTGIGPHQSMQKEIDNLKEVFLDEDYRPDMLKLYPLMVMPGTMLELDYKQGCFTPLNTQEATKIIASFLPHVPRYCRVMRVQRDIPTYRTIAGVDKTNLRQYIDKELEKNKMQSNDIRAHETGRVSQQEPSKFELSVRQYTASKGKEFFIAIHDVANDALAGFCRLRFPSQQLRKEITPQTAIIRELHVYGSALVLGGSHNTSSQHRGFGKQLIAKAQAIAREHNYNHMIIISGIGVRAYYEKLGYVHQGPYMGKKLE